jgi:hypothetical protein
LPEPFRIYFPHNTSCHSSLNGGESSSEFIFNSVDKSGEINGITGLLHNVSRDLILYENATFEFYYKLTSEGNVRVEHQNSI